LEPLSYGNASSSFQDFTAVDRLCDPETDHCCQKSAHLLCCCMGLAMGAISTAQACIISAKPKEFNAR
jgi:hypothetical protein